MNSIKILQLAKKLPLLILFLVLPFLRSSSQIDPHLLIQFVAMQIVVVLMIANSYFNKKRPLSIPGSSIFLIYFSFVVYAGLRLLFADINADAIFDWLKIVSLFLVFFLIVDTYDPQELKKKIVADLSLLGMVLTLWGIYELVVLLQNGSLNIPLDTYQIKTVFGHRNIYGQVLFLCLPFQIFSAQLAKTKYHQLIALASVFLAVFMLIVLSNRATWLALSLGFGFIGLIYLLKKKNHHFNSKFHLRILIITIFMAFVSALLFFNFFTHTNETKSHLVDIVKLDKGSGKDRLELWKRSLMIIEENPVFGVGPAKWKIEMLKYGNKGLVSEDNVTFYQRPHNDFLWISAEYGLVGGLLYLLIFMLAFIALFKSFRNSASKTDTFWFMALMLGLIGYFVYSIFSFPQERIVNGLVFIAVLALIVKGSDSNKYLLNRKFLLPTLLLAAVIIAYFGVQRFDAERHARKVLLAKSEADYDLLLQEAKKISPYFYNMDPLSTPIAWYQGLAYFEKGKAELAQSYFEKALGQNPYHIHVLNNLGSACVKNNNVEQGKRYFKETLSVYPDFEDAKLNLCAVYFNQGLTDSALIILKSIDANTKNPKYQVFKNAIFSKAFKEHNLSNFK